MCVYSLVLAYMAIASQQKLERAPVHNLDADQSVGFIKF